LGAGQKGTLTLTYRILLTPQALKMLKVIPDHRVRGKLSERIEGLAEELQKQGKPLLGPLAGYRSLRAVGQRYRILISRGGRPGLGAGGRFGHA
jgi:mRNA-degrading endonuclease RelE of RelBE toxin-antitoxin system